MTATASFPRLVGDVGGTHARFGIVLNAAGPVQSVARYRCDQFATLWDGLQHYLAEHAPAKPRSCALGVATPITGDRIVLTNNAWSFSIHDLQQRLGVERLLVLNDFSALALSLPMLPASELRQIGGGAPVPGAPIGLIGPGTGLGVSGLLPMPGGHGQLAIGGEGGHVTLSSFDREEAAVLQWVHEAFGHVSAERVLSGPGIENLYQAVCAVGGETRPPLTAQDISEAALARSDNACVKTIDMFCSLLGNVAGNVALTLGARGGVYIGGGIVPRLGDWFDRSQFRERFEAKGRFREYLLAIPTYVVQSDVSPALIGASRALDRPFD
jgi:glucokinase